MRLAIVGSRNFHNYSLMETETVNFILDQDSDIIEIVSGGALGADALAYRFAKENCIPIKIFFADWGKHGKSAGYKRNMLVVQNCDYVLAFWDYKSKGTAHTIKLAEGLNIPVRIIGV